MFQGKKLLAASMTVILTLSMFSSTFIVSADQETIIPEENISQSEVSSQEETVVPEDESTQEEFIPDEPALEDEAITEEDALPQEEVAPQEETPVPEVLTANTQDGVLIAKNSTWQYEDTNTDMYTPQFFTSAFDSSAWKTGKAPLGYPETDYNNTFGAVSSGTLVENQSNPNAYITYYFRNTFTVNSKNDIKKLTATVGIDDGFVIYINGVEVNRSYMDEGEIIHASNSNLVNEASDDTGTVVVDLTSSIDLLADGTNIIAVSVHNRDNKSSDIYFDMELVANAEDDIQTPDTSDIENANKTPKQVNAHMGTNPSTMMNISYTTIDETPTKIVYNIVGDTNALEATGTNSQGASDKYFHAIALTKLQPNSQYEYTVGEGENTYTGSFKTAPDTGSTQPFKFLYVADTQVSNATDAKALGATLAAVNATSDVDFVYLAGDHTNTATNETQWELLFNNDGAFPTGGQDMYGNNTVTVIQGNHDNTTLQRHINAPAEAGNIVYSFDWGSVTFVMLNLETARSDASARAQQEAYLREAVADAKARGQWTFVGFHKSLYSGASHITDSDVKEARMYWHPIFVELDIDVVMQGHDHVYSRGFINATGSNANPTTDENGVVSNPANAPLYMTGGHAGGLKWYSKKNYTVSSGDPLSLGYSFLDVNSTDTGSDINQEQVIVEMEVTNEQFTINTYMFKYNTTTDTITTDKYLYDSVTVERTVPTTSSASLSGSEVGATEINSEVSYVVNLSNVQNANTIEANISYDDTKLEFVSATSLLADTIVNESKAENGNVKVVLGTTTPITTADADVISLVFKVKSGLSPSVTTVSIASALTASSPDGATSDIRDIPTTENASVETKIHSCKSASDINKDGEINLADLSIAVANFGKITTSFDINIDGIVDTADYILLMGYYMAA